jgi:type VI secretion system protein ImpK
VPHTGVNSLVSAASTIFELIVRLRSGAGHRDVAGLHREMIAEIRGFEAVASAGGNLANDVRMARYALCATVDDVVLNTPWGSESIWPRQSMVGTFHKETFGGEGFFQLLDQLQQDPRRHLAVLEVMYLCLALGFQGQMRLAPDGPGMVDRLRERLYQLIRSQKDRNDDVLSPHWRGVEAGHRPLRSFAPAWFTIAGLAMLLVVLFVGFRVLLASQIAPVVAALHDLPPRAMPVVIHPKPASLYQQIRGFLVTEIAKNQVTVTDGPEAVTIEIPASDMFASGDDQIAPQYGPLLKRIAAALAQNKALVLVAGYTDNVPIHTPRFPNNLALSLARAVAVRAILVSQLGAPSRIAAEGHGSTQPIASNATREGRMRNRRVDILVLKSGRQ